MDKRLVLKFGGTSMGTYEAMVQSARVAIARQAHVIVVSAMAGVTNQLIAIIKAASKQDDCYKNEIDAIETRHSAVLAQLGLPSELAWLDGIFADLTSHSQRIFQAKECLSRDHDAVVSLGERLSSLVFTEVLKMEQEKVGLMPSATLFDVRTVMRTNDEFSHAKPQITAIKCACQRWMLPLLDEGLVLVTQGFIGRSPDGETTTLGRGGSDYSAALLAEALQARAVEIWTDVPGIATTDPRLLPSAKIIPEISFAEASELATFGAKVLHPATVLPAIRQQIPVFVASTFEPEKHGTWVKAEVDQAPLVRAIALKRKQVLLTLSTPEMLYAHGFLARVFSIFADFKISVDNITTSLVSVALTLDDSTTLNNGLLSCLKEVAEVTREDGLALVSIIGNRIKHTPGLSRRVFETIEDINVRMIGMGASEHQFCLLVPEAMAETAVRRLHQALIS